MTRCFQTGAIGANGISTLPSVKDFEPAIGLRFAALRGPRTSYRVAREFARNR
jgi:hypothetical protein